MFKILLIGLKNNENLGDVIISDCTEFLLKMVMKDLNQTEYEITTIDMTEEDYSLIASSDLVVFSGGGIIKYKYQKFYIYLDKITYLAEELGVPVILNAVGVEGYDDTNENCLILKNALNRTCIKQITTRDDLGLLRDRYITNQNIKVDKVADSAVWASDIFEINRNEKSDIIGLGVIREGIFKSNGIDLGYPELIRLWGDIICELESRQLKWNIFTTGWPSDMKFALNLMKELGREDEIEDKVMKEPKSAAELINTIAQYKGIIAGRLHANIIAYSLRIPSVGLVWNDKLNFWGETIHAPKRFFKHSNFNASMIVNGCLEAINEGYEEENRENFKQTVYKSLKEGLYEILYQGGNQ